MSAQSQFLDVIDRDEAERRFHAALDLRPAELEVTVPLIACLLALSAWPAAISGHSFQRNLGALDAACGFQKFPPPTTHFGCP